MTETILNHERRKHVTDEAINQIVSLFGEQICLVFMDCNKHNFDKYDVNETVGPRTMNLIDFNCTWDNTPYENLFMKMHGFCSSIYRELELNGAWPNTTFQQYVESKGSTIAEVLSPHHYDDLSLDDFDEEESEA